jgi:copper chaperone CopZ
MKKAVLSFIFSLFLLGGAMANNPGEITVKSSVVCEMCKETIEEGLAYEKGIKRVQVDVEANTIYVKYNDKKLNEQEIKDMISKLGYAADDVKPDKKAYDSLHACCQKPGACGDK